MTGRSAGSTSLTGPSTTANKIATLGSFTAVGTFTLDDSANLLLNGPVSAATINVDDGASTLTLGTGGLDTAGANRPTGTLKASQLPPESNGLTQGLGAYLSAGSVTQTGGGFDVSNTYSGTQSVLSIVLAAGNGSLQFGAAPGGLQGPNTWLIVSVGGGSASGNINVKAFDFGFTMPPGTASFTGSVDGNTGAAGAGTANIQPQPNANFRINGCPIHSVNCALLATQGLPQSSPVSDINVGAPLNTENPEDLVLPVVSDERYELVPCTDPNAAEGCPAEAPLPEH